jgi:hypothetical protein
MTLLKYVKGNQSYRRITEKSDNKGMGLNFNFIFFKRLLKILVVFICRTGPHYLDEESLDQGSYFFL